MVQENNNSGKVEKINDPQKISSLDIRGIKSELLNGTLGSIHSGDHTGLYSNKVSLINSRDDNLEKIIENQKANC